jgi:hypothetical protein
MTEIKGKDIPTQMGSDLARNKHYLSANIPSAFRTLHHKWFV